MNNKIYIIISGGNLQAVYSSDKNADVKLIDEDNGACDDECREENERLLSEIKTSKAHYVF